ncbi:adenylyl-sulfate kinase [Aquariibacter albus]|uniref:Adenylyl-sulfate kinase n=1 Tax=Aquariibacter albus TaxID=2759899 RepID=A0A839HFE5_9BURK|nr:adenylyl-sulfate kinase [Aquariibacter albus]MBB1160525.1 adenylyl-sulfate kinase [Aquariibacter albus]
MATSTPAPGPDQRPGDGGGELHAQALSVSRQDRAALLGQTPRVLWLTGLSGAGKSTIANAVCERLHRQGRISYLLDGDHLRGGLSRDLGFSEADRKEQIRRVAEVARLMVDAGLIVLTALISPFRADRALARDRFAPGEFLEVFVDVPLAVAEARDPKRLYAKARAGTLASFTGIGSRYEPPTTPELHLRTDEETVDVCVARVLALLDRPPTAGR